MKTLRTDELAELLAGGDSYIRTKDNVVKGLAVKIELNPEAPEVLIVGKGPRKTANAKLFVDQNEYVPLYIKQGVNSWQYNGEYKAVRYSTDKKAIEKFRCHRDPNEIDGILFLERLPENDPSDIFPSNADQENKKKSEEAAINHVTKHYEKLGYTVEDKQKDNCGYDLLMRLGEKQLRIEVKGTTGTNQFFITRNEYNMSSDPRWRLALVTNCLHDPKLEEFTMPELESEFDIEPLQWHCTRKN